VLESLGFTFVDGGGIDSEIPAGLVASTDPGPGTQSAKGAIVTVYSSLGNKVPLPDVVEDGKSNNFSEAQSTLNAAGFTSVAESCVVLAPASGPGPVMPNDPRVGKVQATDPPPGALVVPGAPVTVAIGKVTCP
jgi:beta-lactam-binding protein with PASTA domain